MILDTRNSETDDEVSRDDAKSKSRARDGSKICTTTWGDGGDIDGIHGGKSHWGQRGFYPVGKLRVF